MGLLSAGKTAGSWYEVKQHANYIREHGITQFLNHFPRLCGRQGNSLKWGDEVEYIVVKFDHEHKKVRVNTRAYEILQDLLKQEDISEPWRNQFLWRPEYGSYMIEGTPGRPYGGTFAAFNLVEDNMRRRRAAVKQLLLEDEAILSIGNFPRLGCPEFVFPPSDPATNKPGAISNSLFLPDEVISPHPRMTQATRNIRERRGRKVIINVPIDKDTNTSEKFAEDFQKLDGDGEAGSAAKVSHIYMDAPGFGLGCCCLQVTIQAANISEARWLYDQLIPITPILLAVSASTPIFRGYLANVDSRWNVISAAADDRTSEELGEEPLRTPGARLIPNSRFDTASSYLHFGSVSYNDIELVHDKATYDRLLGSGIDAMLARHISHLFIRDPIVVYSDRVDLDDLQTLEHFENIQSSNYQSLRFKIPPVDNPSIGWRVEFRPMDVQLTDFENAACATFIVLLTRVLISFRFSFLIPISKVNANMERAQVRDAVLDQKFYFRAHVAACDMPRDLHHACTPGGCPQSGKLLPEPFANVEDGGSSVAQFTEMTADEILNGRRDFPGLIPLIHLYLDSADVDIETRCKLQQYLTFISQRASGKIMTMARWMRSFVRSHPKYNHDSVVTDEINYDLLSKCLDIQEGRDLCPELLGESTGPTCSRPKEV